MWWNDGMDEYMVELARRFAASFISVQMHTSFNTEYRKLKDQRPGELWISLAVAATQAIAAHGQQTQVKCSCRLRLRGRRSRAAMMRPEVAISITCAPRSLA